MTVQRILLTVPEVAEMLGMSRDWVYKKSAAGELPHRKLGSVLRFVRADIEAWLTQQPGRGA
jgi:excisionase family DNA binding protein